MIVEDKQFVVFVPPVLIPHRMGHCVRKVHAADAADCVMQAFNFGRPAIPEAVTDEQVFLRLAIGVSTTSLEKGVPVHLIAKPREPAIARSQDPSANTGQFISIAARNRLRLKGAEERALGDLRSETSKGFFGRSPVDSWNVRSHFRSR